MTDPNDNRARDSPPNGFELDGRVPGRLSVVVPTYERSEMLNVALESVCTQTYTNIELIVVDDGSSVPVTESMLPSTADRLTSVKIRRHETNRGANVARNTGICASTGEYIGFLDDDDRWNKQKAERVVSRFESTDPAVGVVYTGKQTERSNGIESITVPTWSGDVTKKLLVGKNFGQFSAVTVRARVIPDAGLPDERFPAWQDREWFFRLSQNCQFEPIEAPLTIRKVTHTNRIGYGFKAQRDIAYPLFIDKHYQMAREYGRYYARSFVASLRRALAGTALRCGRYREARKYYLLSLAANPLQWRSYPYVAATIGGRWSYQPIRRLKRTITGVA